MGVDEFVEVLWADGRTTRVAADRLSLDESAEIFGRTGAVAQVRAGLSTARA